MDPETVLQLVNKTEIHALGKEVRALLQRVCASLKATRRDKTRAHGIIGRETPGQKGDKRRMQKA
jgi:hypothetical protein